MFQDCGISCLVGRSVGVNKLVICVVHQCPAGFSYSVTFARLPERALDSSGEVGARWLIGWLPSSNLNQCTRDEFILVRFCGDFTFHLAPFHLAPPNRVVSSEKSTNKQARKRIRQDRARTVYNESILELPLLATWIMFWIIHSGAMWKQSKS